MTGSRDPHRSLGRLLVLLLVAGACAAPGPTTTLVAPPGWGQQATETVSYTIVLRTGPAVDMGVMQPETMMTAMDEGRPVNHHMEIHAFDRSSGAEVKTHTPVVTITDVASGVSRGIPNVQACLLANHRVTEPHFGDNLYLVEGSYSVTVAVGSETAVFGNVVIADPDRP